MKRAITLGGGGPAAGLHIGALKAFEEFDIDFDVWSLSCIGVWVGGQYLSYPKAEALRRTEEHFRKYIFVDDTTYDKWPIGAGFTPNLQSWMEATVKFMTDPKSYENLFSPAATDIAIDRWKTFMSDPKYWQPAGFNQLFSAMAAANPVTRYMVSSMWLSPLTGMTGGDQKGPSLTPNTNVDALFEPDKPFVYHNAWNMKEDKMELFCNQKNPQHGMRTMSSASMGACSALPYIIQPKMIDGVPYCEGALVRTVSFTGLLRDHPDLDEVWVLRIVDPGQVRPTESMDDALNNLTMLFAGALGEQNVENYERAVKECPEMAGRVKFLNVPVSTKVNFDWSHSNYDLGIKEGYKNTKATILKHLEDANA